MTRPARALRARVRAAITLVAVIALFLFGIPLAVVLDRLLSSQALAGLQRDATRAVAAVPDNVLEVGSHVRAPVGTTDTHLGVYDAKGVRVAGIGPARSALAGRVSDGHEHDGHDAGDLSVVVPVLSDTTVAGSVRAAVPLSRLHARVWRAWALLATLAAVVVTIALLLASRAARRISEPFEHLTSAARGLGQGRFELALPASGILEADAAGAALTAGGLAVDGLIRNEREFVRDASHQLRTPLAGVLLHLDRNEPDVAAALAGVRHLEATIEDLLALRGLPDSNGCKPADVAAEVVARWLSPTRRVALRVDETDDVTLSEAALRQSLDVLLDNAFRHGQGPVTVTVEPHGDSVVIEVADEGAGFSPDAPAGTGLAMVTGIVERAGGTVLVRRRAPRPRVALIVPLRSQPISKR